MNDDPLPEHGLEVSLLDLQTIEVDRRRLESIAMATALSEGAHGEISIVLVDAEKMAELNSQFRKKCGPTDVLSFSIDGLVEGGAADLEHAPFLIGEVIVCPEVAQKQAKDGLQGEMDLLVAHGVLHLLGYDHDTEEEAARMRGREHDLTGRSGASAS